MKYLVIGVLVSIIFVLVYARVRPYLQLIQKILQSLNAVTEINTPVAQTPKRTSRNKLIRCDRCGTWIPAERAVETFCSRECQEAFASRTPRSVSVNHNTISPTTKKKISDSSASR